MNNFKKLLSSRRKELKMTQRDLAEKLNVSDKTISKWETGASYPDITLLNTIAKVLDLDINDIFDVDDLKETKVILEEQEVYDQDVINKYKSKVFLSIGLIVAAIIITLTSIAIYNDNLQIVMWALGLVLYGFSLIYNISSNINFRSFYNRKFYTRNYDYVYFKYSSLVIILLVLPFSLYPIISKSPINFSNLNIYGIFNFISILIVIISLVVIIRISQISNFKMKKDKINIILMIVAILLFIAVITNLLYICFLPIVYGLLYTSIFRNNYINSK